MANEQMRVVALMARKGGSGKSSLVKAFASAALAGGKSTLMIDTDPQGDVTMWFQKLKDRGVVPPGVAVHAATSTADMEDQINGAYEKGNVDFIFVDTAGAGTGWSDQIAMLADHLVTPLMPSDADLLICAQTVDWFKGLHSRVENPETLPSHRVVITRFPASAKATKIHMRMLHEASKRFPLCSTVIQERTAYIDMDEQGFLGELAKYYRAQSDPLQRSQARRFEDAIVESTELLNDVLGR